MPIHNSDVVAVFNQMADLLEVEGSNPFRVRAYRNAARTVGGLSQRVADLVERGEDLSLLPGIGKDLAGKMAEIVRTGTLSQLQEFEKRIPAELSRLMEVSGLGPKRVKVLYERLGVSGLEDLKAAAEVGKIRELPGFGKKTEEAVLESLQRVQESQKRLKRSVAEEIAAPLVAYLQRVKGVKDVVVAGSYRRRLETVGDLDFLATCERGSQVMNDFVRYEDVEDVVSKGQTRSTVRLRSGLQTDLRVVPEVSFGAALLYFTGSKAHNIEVRKLGQKRELKINEYGVFRGEKRVGGKTEKEVYKLTGLPYIEPELRENRGEIEAALKDRLPRLITLEDLRGNLHNHTTESDGHNTLEEMARAAQERRLKYLAISDHSRQVRVANGLDARRLARQIKEIDRLNGKLRGIVLLKSLEVDILQDGSLDLPEEMLRELDLTVCAVHSRFRLSREKQTERILRAMDDPCAHILAHPSGRLIGERSPFEVDLERLMKAAREGGWFLELNAQPDRLDLSDTDCKMAKEMGVKVAISADAHSATDLDYLHFGVDQARRGWLEPEDVLNTRSWNDLKKLLNRR